jgi:quercetin dioxygenase-like cupin family protein
MENANIKTGTERNVIKLLAGITEYHSPKIIGEVNDVFIKITKVKGNEVPWHSHDNEDEMFYMIKGSMVMELENRDAFELNEGEFYIVPKGVKHRVHSEEESWMMLIENKETRHTGDVKSSITRSIEEQM